MKSEAQEYLKLAANVLIDLDEKSARLTRMERGNDALRDLSKPQYSAEEIRAAFFLISLQMKRLSIV